MLSKQMPSKTLYRHHHLTTHKLYLGDLNGLKEALLSVLKLIYLF